MKKYFILFLLLISLSAFAQINAITDNGDLVLLHADGTWNYADSSALNDFEEIPVNPNPFFKPASSKFLLKSNDTPFGFWINPKEWTFTKSDKNEDSEYELNHKDKDLYGIIITERISIPIDALRMIAIENAKDAVTQLKVVEDEFRTVNGIQVFFMRMQGLIQGIHIEYRSYYFSTDEGTVQYITFSSAELMEEYAEDSDNLLNGLILISEE